MADDDKQIQIRKGGGIFQNLADRATNIARTRAVEEENKLADAVTRNQQLRVKYNDARREVGQSQDRLRDVQAYIDKDRAAIRAETEQLDFRQKELESKSDEIASEHTARMKQNVAAATAAEAAAMQAEADKLKAEMLLDELREKKARKLLGSSVIIEEMEAKLTELREVEIACEAEIEGLLDPAFDSDERMPHKRREAQQRLVGIQAKIATLEAELDTWR